MTMDRIRHRLERAGRARGRALVAAAFAVGALLEAAAQWVGQSFDAPLPAAGSILFAAVATTLVLPWCVRRRRAAIAALTALAAGPLVVAAATIGEDLGFGMAPALFRPTLLAHHFHIWAILLWGPLFGAGLSVATLAARLLDRSART